jgi:3-phosphoshikimate 1-carboxyvinyltransferase
VPGVIDELPVLAALSHGGGELRCRARRSFGSRRADRISALAEGLRRMGGHDREQPDGFHVTGGGHAAGGESDARHDHRLAMAFAVAGSGRDGPTIDP